MLHSRRAHRAYGSPMLQVASALSLALGLSPGALVFLEGCVQELL